MILPRGLNAGYVMEGGGKKYRKQTSVHELLPLYKDCLLVKQVLRAFSFCLGQKRCFHMLLSAEMLSV